MLAQPPYPNFLMGLGAAALTDTSFARVKRELEPTLTKWGNGHLLHIRPSGSYAKGTVVAGSSDVDLFCSVSSSVSETLQEIYDKLANALTAANYVVRRQNVSLGIEVKGYKVDVTPGRRQNEHGNDHSLYSSKRNSWIKTDIVKQISYVRQSGRLAEIRFLKQWRNAQGIDWPSYYLEIYTIDALRGRPKGDFVANVRHVWLQLAQGNIGQRLVDPANSNNDLSEEMNWWQRALLANQADRDLVELGRKLSL